MRYFITALGLAFTLAFGLTAMAFGNTSWDDSSNGHGYYHTSNG
jgi:hypothetical protein